jgi:hypothetical protein
MSNKVYPVGGAIKFIELWSIFISLASEIVRENVAANAGQGK